MNFIYRGIISTKKNLIKTLLLFLILSIISTTVFSLNLAINSILNSTENIRTSIPIVTTAKQTHFNLDQPLSSDTIKTIGDLPYVKNYNYSIPSGAFSTLIEYSPESTFDGGNMHFGFDDINSSFWLNGVSHINLINIEYGLFSLVEGRVFTQVELDNPDLDSPTPILLPRQVAELNNLTLGSVFNLYTTKVSFPHDISFEVYKDMSFEERIDLYWDYTLLQEHEVYIIGLLDINLNKVRNVDNLHMQYVIYNTIFTPNWFTQILDTQSLKNLDFNHRLEYYNSGWVHQPILNVYWTLENIDSLSEFTKAANEILPYGFAIEDWINTFLPLENAMNQVNNISQQFLIFILIASVIIITLTILLFYHDRRHELGVYVALGEKKLKIIAQLMFEITFISLVAIILSFLVGKQVATHFTNNLLLTELNREFEEIQNESWVWSQEQGRFVMQEVFHSQLEFHGIQRDLTIYELQDLFSISMTDGSILSSAIIILITLFLGSIVPLLYVLEINPKKLLM